ncbi:hypothetical protein SAMN05660493_01494 [Epilithonimonas bovis DSM 19482]|uniref:Uncharacterized protein n=1 Tax=Epilithonimonas bovis DSM 19482 TaxID=1121284 RepID=A0A1U7PV86_9FLAO|nr:hypothetical protein SAMN05660493_01494 [Epilithonimonas bovis DSM 19482]
MIMDYLFVNRACSIFWGECNSESKGSAIPKFKECNSEIPCFFGGVQFRKGEL